MKRNALIAPLCCLALCSSPKTARAQFAWSQDDLSGVHDPISAQYATGSVLVSGFNVMATLHNTGHASDSPKWGYMGVLSGVLGIGLGGASLIEDPSSEAKPLAIANIAIGTLATFSALSAIKHAKSEKPEDVAVAGHMPIHFAAGVVGARGHQHGLGVQLTF